MYLQHHGILGQKWGVRRFQNEDGTYTKAGKLRRNGNFITKDEHYTYLIDDQEEKIAKEKHLAGVHNYNKDIYFEKGSHFERITSTENEDSNKRKYITQDIQGYNDDIFSSGYGKTWIKAYKAKKTIAFAGYETVNRVLKEIGEQPMNGSYFNRDFLNNSQNPEDEYYDKAKNLTAALKKKRLRWCYRSC